MGMTWGKDLKPIFRPKPGTVHMGKMKVDPKRCTGCGLCIENCLFRTWEMGEGNVPHFKENWPCFSCYNCMVACPMDAISIEEPYHVDSGFWKTLPHFLMPKLPLEPHNAEGKQDEWTPVEKIIFNRRTVRNFSDKPVPEPLIRRVLEAGRFAPTSGNAQPLQFVVATNKALIEEMNASAYNILKAQYDAYMDDEQVKELAKRYEVAPNPGDWDPRIILGGIGKSIVGRVNPVLLGAPVVILIAADTRTIAGPRLQVGICGQNMILAAMSLGLSATWVGFAGVCDTDQRLKHKLGIKRPFSIIVSIVLGYSRFRQKGIVSREFRPIIWHREGGPGREIEDTPLIPEVKVHKSAL